jgi:hypothetical protein
MLIRMVKVSFVYDLWLTVGMIPVQIGKTLPAPKQVSRLAKGGFEYVISFFKIFAEWLYLVFFQIEYGDKIIFFDFAGVHLALTYLGEFPAVGGLVDFLQEVGPSGLGLPVLHIGLDHFGLEKNGKLCYQVTGEEKLVRLET